MGTEIGIVFSGLFDTLLSSGPLPDVSISLPAVAIVHGLK